MARCSSNLLRIHLLLQVFSQPEIQAICDLCISHDTLMISDDVYEHMVFDDSKMVRVASLPGMWDRTITIGSAGETLDRIVTYHTTPLERGELDTCVE